MNSNTYDKPYKRRVIYTGASQSQIDWGGNDDPRSLLTIGEEYEVESTDVRSWHTKITLVGIKGRFNDASFKRCG